jgi:predicted nucleic acid-binding protein
VPGETVLLDACVAINVVAADSLDEIAEALDISLAITRQAANEVGFLREVSSSEVISTAISLEHYSEKGAIEVVELQVDEYALYVELAAIVDDGEASTIAVAASRGLALATDDRKARRLCEEKNIPEPLRTLALIHAYADAVSLEQREICHILKRIRDRASFQPPRNDPDHKWWNDLMALHQHIKADE